MPDEANSHYTALLEQVTVDCLQKLNTLTMGFIPTFLNDNQIYFG